MWTIKINAQLLNRSTVFQEETLDEFVKDIEPENIGKLASISPFLSWDAWDINTDKAISAGDVFNLLDVAPFLPTETLMKLQG